MRGFLPYEKSSTKHCKIALGTRRTIHEHVPCRRWQSTCNSVQFARDMHLASKARGISEPERHVEHVILVIIWLRQFVVELLR